MTFRLGQKVVCIDDAWTLHTGKPAQAGFGFLPQKGLVYTIADVITQFVECAYVRLHEASWDEIYEASAFRPLIERKTDIATFTQILRRESAPRVIATADQQTQVSA